MQFTLLFRPASLSPNFIVFFPDGLFLFAPLKTVQATVNWYPTSPQLKQKLPVHSPSSPQWRPALWKCGVTQRIWVQSIHLVKLLLTSTEPREEINNAKVPSLFTPVKLVIKQYKEDHRGTQERTRKTLRLSNFHLLFFVYMEKESRRNEKRLKIGPGYNGAVLEQTGVHLVPYCIVKGGRNW